MRTSGDGTRFLGTSCVLICTVYIAGECATTTVFTTVVSAHAVRLCRTFGGEDKLVLRIIVPVRSI